MTAAGRQAIRQRFDAPLAELIAEAAALRDSAHGRLISYSRKVFIPLTKLCRDVCHYCTFTSRPTRGSPLRAPVRPPVAPKRCSRWVTNPSCDTRPRATH